MEESVLSSEIRSKEHLRAFDDLAAFRFAAIELEKILVYAIDTVDADALPFLAEQFNVLGLRGWNSAKTEQDKRDLIKRAVELHRFAGTPYAIRRALQSVGYADIQFEEGVGPLYDGYFLYDGTITYGAGNWATFRATVDLGEGKGINSVDTPELIGLINTWKNARSKLVGLYYKATVSDNVTAVEETTLNATIVHQDTVDPLGEDNNLIVSQDLIADNYSGLADGGIDLSVKNSLGVEINHYIF